MPQSNKVCIYNRKKERQSKKHTYSIQTVHIHLHIKSCAARGGDREWRENEEDVNKGESKNTFIIYDL